MLFGIISTTMINNTQRIIYLFSFDSLCLCFMALSIRRLALVFGIEVLQDIESNTSLFKLYSSLLFIGEFINIPIALIW